MSRESRNDMDSETLTRLAREAYEIARAADVNAAFTVAYSAILAELIAQAKPQESIVTPPFASLAGDSLFTEQEIARAYADLHYTSGSTMRTVFLQARKNRAYDRQA